MDAILGSFVVVALAEMGDKTQLLAFSLASRYRRPWTVLSGILVATIVNHALASSVGAWVSAQVSPRVLAGVLAATFVGFAIWTLRADTLDEAGRSDRFGPFLTTALLFFLAEMGDKTQLATVALAARYGTLVLVTIGTTLGMLAADGLAVFLGERLSNRIPLRLARVVAAAAFLAFGAASAWAAWRGA